MGSLILLSLLGVFVGVIGTMIGAGGGFILVPILLIIYPDKSPEEITSISLAVVFFNAVSGTLAYQKMKRIDYKSGILFSIAIVPGAILGSLVVGMLSRNIFNLIFGTLLIVIATYLILKPDNKNNVTSTINKNFTYRQIIDSDNYKYAYAYNKKLGLGLSLIVGFVSSLLGIGGGIIHVPILVHVLNFPVHLATATSYFILTIMAFSGSLIRLFNGTLSDSYLSVLVLAIGAIIGAQIGARLSKKLKGRLIIKILALTLSIVGLRILFLAFK